MAKDVIVNITQQKVIGNNGLGFPLVISGRAETAIPYVECTNLDEVKAAGFDEDSDVYAQCNAIFAQKNAPSIVAVCATTEKITVELDKLKTKGFRQIIPIFGVVTDVGTEDEPTEETNPTPPNSGENGETEEPGTEPDGNPEGQARAAEPDDTLEALAKYVEATQDKMMFVSQKDTTGLETLGELERTFVIVYKGEGKGVEGALVGATAGLDAGSFTYKNMILNGIVPDELTDTEISDIHAAGANAIVRKAGDVVTSEGKVISGEYADIIDSQDYIINNIEYSGQKLLNQSAKLSFDNIGISQLEGVVTNVLANAFRMGIIATDEDGTTPMYSTNFASAAETSATDKSKRVYNGGKFTFQLAGSIHAATINGVLVV